MRAETQTATTVSESPSLRVLQSARWWLPQTETWLYNQVRHLPAGIESHIVCQDTLNLDQFGLPNIHSLRSEPGFAFSRERLLRKMGLRRHLAFWEHVAKAAMVSLIHSHFGPMGWQDSAWVQRLGLRHIVSFYGEDVGRYPNGDSRWMARYRDMFASVDLVLCEGPYMAASIVELGCPAEKVVVHRLGIMLDSIRYEARSWSPGEPLRVLMAASFREKKGLTHGIRALARLRRRLPVEVTLIGDADGSKEGREQKAQILSAIEESGMTECVDRRGFVKYATLLEEVYRHHVYLSPSIVATDGDCEGGAPVALIEMAASGMPVVSTRHCDIPQVLEDRKTGLLAEERDVEGLAANLLWLAEHPERWQAMTAAAREHIEANFDARAQGIRLGEIYHRVANGGWGRRDQLDGG